MKKLSQGLLFLAFGVFVFLFAKCAFAFMEGLSSTLGGSVLGGIGGGGGFGGTIIGIVISLFGFGMTSFCWFCDLYKTLFDIMNHLATTVATSLRGDFLVLLGVGVLFFVAFKVLAAVSKLQEVDLMQFLGELFKHLGRAIVAAAFIAGTIQMYQYLVSPFLAYALALTLRVMVDGGVGDGAGGVMGMAEKLVMKALGGGSDGSKFIPHINAAVLDGGGMAFSNQIRDMLIAILEITSASLISGMIIGAVVILIGIADAYLNIIPNFQIVIVGFTILGAYFGIYLAIPFKLIDVMVRLTFVAALTPLWIILWVFPATANYTKNAWEMLLNCCACIICLGVVLVITFEILRNMLPNKEMIIGFLLGGLDMLATGQMNLINPAVLQTFALGMLASSLVKNSSNIATQIVKSYGTSMGDGLEKAVGDGISSMGKLGAALGGTALALQKGSFKEVSDMSRGMTKGMNNYSMTGVGDDMNRGKESKANERLKALEQISPSQRTSAQQKEINELQADRKEAALARKDNVNEKLQDTREEIAELNTKRQNNGGSLSTEDQTKLETLTKQEKTLQAESTMISVLEHNGKLSATDYDKAQAFLQASPTASYSDVMNHLATGNPTGGAGGTSGGSNNPAGRGGTPGGAGGTGGTGGAGGNPTGRGGTPSGTGAGGNTPR